MNKKDAFEKEAIQVVWAYAKNEHKMSSTW